MGMLVFVGCLVSSVNMLADSNVKPLILPDFSGVSPVDREAPVHGVVTCVDKEGFPTKQGEKNVKECNTTVFKNNKKVKVNATVDADGKPGAGFSLGETGQD